MKRQDILKEYKIDESGIIKTPGMFEGEMLYVPYFWDAYLNGCADRDDGHTLGFDVTAEDKAEFPELKRRKTVKLTQSHDGFIWELR